MKRKLIVLYIILASIIIIVLTSLSLYFLSGGNLSKLSEEELYRLIDDNINLRSEITGNKLLVKKCIKQLNKKLNKESEIYIENNTVFITDGINEMKYMELRKTLKRIDGEKQKTQIEVLNTTQVY